MSRWIFDLDLEVELCNQDILFKKFCYWQAVNDVNSGAIQANEKMYQLKALQNADRCEQVDQKIFGSGGQAS